jgi:Protein of unknown function (DUF2971)
MNSLPKVLYKYCNRWGVDILRHHRLKVTPFNQFNDPFELAPRMRPDFSVEDARKAIASVEFQRDLYAVTFTRGQFNGSFEQFAELIGVVRDDLAANLSENYPKDAAEFRLRHLDTISSDVGLICLSAVPNDILMWSHYTKGHTGFVIGFDTTNEFFARPTVLEVDYQEERVLMGHYSDPRDAKRLAEIVNSMIRRKSPHWAYEKEWRQPHVLADCVHQPDPRQADKLIHYKIIPSGAVCEVITGSRCDSKDVDELLSHAEFAHVKRCRARIHDTEFKLTFEDA